MGMGVVFVGMGVMLVVVVGVVLMIALQKMW